MSDLEVITFRPSPDQYAWTFGGAAPVMRIRPPAVLEVYAQHDMVTWIASLCGLDLLDAYQLVTQAVESPLANVCDTSYTSVAKIAKRYLGHAGAPMEDAHGRLRELAAEYRG